MSWTVTLPGQPISGNHAYRLGKGYRRGGISYPKIIKTPETEAYQRGVVLLVRTARPTGWSPGDGRLRIRWKFYLTRIADSDNLVKVLSDALALALDVNDRRFNHCVEDVILVGHPREARVEVSISTDPRCCLPVLGEGIDPPR